MILYMFEGGFENKKKKYNVFFLFNKQKPHTK